MGVWRGKGGDYGPLDCATRCATRHCQSVPLVGQPGTPLLLSRSNGCPEIHSGGAPWETMKGEGFITDFRFGARGQGERQRRSLIQSSNHGRKRAPSLERGPNQRFFLPASDQFGLTLSCGSQALMWLWWSFGVALGWLWGAYRLATNWL